MRSSADVQNCIPSVQHQDWRGQPAARPGKLLGHDLDEAGQADRVLVEERHDAQPKTLLCLQSHALCSGSTATKQM